MCCANFFNTDDGATVDAPELLRIQSLCQLHDTHAYQMLRIRSEHRGIFMRCLKIYDRRYLYQLHCFTFANPNPLQKIFTALLQVIFWVISQVIPRAVTQFDEQAFECPPIGLIKAGFNPFTGLSQTCAGYRLQ